MATAAAQTGKTRDARQLRSDAALRAALDRGLSPDDLALRLAALQPPQGQADGPPMQLWTAAAPPAPCDPADPGAVLDRLFSCS